MAKYLVEKLKTFKTPLIVISIATLLLDLATFILLCVFQYEFKYILCPIFAFVIDALFVVAAFNTNYRFKYSKVSYVLYILATIILSVIPFLTINVFGKTAIFTTISALVQIAAHIGLMVSVGYFAKVASKPNDKVVKIIPFASSIALSVICVLVALFIINNGYFGQGNESRTIVYEYNAKTNTYKAVDLLGGKGNTVVIPNQFNGSDITEIDLAIFDRDDISKVVIDTENFVLTNNKNVSEINTNLEISIDQKTYDYFKNELYETKRDDLINLANNTKPIVEEGKVYVSFAYTKDELVKLNYKPLPTWFGYKGDKFDMNYFSKLEYTRHTDSSTFDDLYWCYTNFNSNMLKPFVVGGQQLQGMAISNNLDNVDIELIDIYYLKLNDGNDSKYEIPDEYRYSRLSSGQNIQYLLSTYENLDNIFDNISDREGFTLKLNYGSTSYNSLKEAYSKKQTKVLTLTPKWELDTPEISSVKVNDKLVNLSKDLEFTYGDDVKLTPTLKEAVDGIVYEYKWTKSGSQVSTKLEYLESLRTVGDNQKYVLTVKAYSNTVTSLTSSENFTFVFDVDKKELNFTWDLKDNGESVNFRNLVYDGKDKEVSVSYEGALASDVITYHLRNENSDTMTSYTYNDACSDTLTIELTGKTAECYKLSSSTASTKTFEVSKREITVAIDSATSVYGDEIKQISYELTNGSLVNNQSLEDVVSVSYPTDLTKASNAGSYDAETEVKDDNYSVTFDNWRKNYTITARPITVTVADKTSVYGDVTSELTAAITAGELVNGDIDSEVYRLSSVVTNRTNVGSYTISGSRLNSNYNIAFNNGTYSITARPITVTIANKSGVYGNALEEFTATVSGRGLVDAATSVYSLSSVVTSKSDVGSYTIKGTNLNSNYDISFVDGNYTITERPITVSIEDKTSVYGDTLATLTAKVTGLGLVDDASSVYSLTTSASSKSDVDSYAITGTQLNSNYDITFSNGNYTITARPITVEVEGKSSVYGDSIVNLTAKVTGRGLVDDASKVYSLATTAKATSNVGSYEITGTQLDTNYTITFKNANYTITARPITVTIANKTSVYGNSTEALTANVTSGELVNGDSNVYTLSTTANSTSSVGSYTITGTRTNTNYNITFVKGSYSITARLITVKIADKTSVYGDSIVALTASITDGELVNGDLESATYTLSTTAKSTSNVGNYIINGTRTNTNYNIIFVKGNYEITARPITVTIADKTSVYGDTLATLTASVTTGKLVNNDIASSVYTLSTTATTASPVGNYEIAGTPNNANYNVTFVDGTYAITARPITVTIANKTSVYGEAIATLTANVTSGTIVNNDSNVYTLSTAAKTTSNVGTYDIAGTSNNTNYNVTFVNGTYTITPASLYGNVISSSTTHVYDGQAHKIKVTVLSPLTTANVTYSLYENGGYTTTEPTFTEVGTYVVYYKVYLNDNYTTVYGYETVTITEAA